MSQAVSNRFRIIIQMIVERTKQVTKSVNSSLVSDLIIDLTRSKRDLLVENLTKNGP